MVSRTAIRGLRKSDAILLDKSAFQALSRNEHGALFVLNYFMTVPPILGYEIIADLSKKFRKGIAADDKVKEFAQKFCGSGGPVNVPWSILCLADLDGENITADGRPLVGDFTEGTMSDGHRAVLMEPAPLNEAIMRWAAGGFTEEEGQFAVDWRKRAEKLSLDPLWQQLRRRHVLLSRPTEERDLGEVVRAALRQPGLQAVWVEYLLAQLRPRPEIARDIWQRWRTEGGDLASFAPYATHCITAQLLLLVASKHKLVKTKATDLIDAQYLYYTPFCRMFVTDDKLQRALAPFLLRPDQRLATSSELKAELEQPPPDSPNGP